MFKSFSNKVTVIISAFVLFLCSICATPAHSPNSFPEPTINSKQFISKHELNRTELVRQVDNYISQTFPSSKLTGTAIVKACIKHDFDICFALAQAEIESGFGTAGVAKKTNSPWNVGAWDSRSAQTMNKLGYSYSHPDLSIEPYIKLVQTKYLGDKRTIHDLMRNYVTLTGKRYASNTSYERKLSETYKKICSKTNLRQLQKSL